MTRMLGQVRIIPFGHARPSEVRNISWLDKPKTDMAREASKSVQDWAQFQQYRGHRITVSKENLHPDNPEGRGTLTVEGVNTHYFVVVPASQQPVQAESLFEGGL
ncbi:hypothetical protein [Arthrobacter sp. JUb115]|uniref:hypothetical protein n=1 Tax=Arthrobacter sp. JUb115 TaxID=2485108 RepID=UPI001060D6F3|nr:hypothetical protein [Arthrobacter sp. JUb115]TDU27068.1 hypothetical protein EDF61_104144 [Arthrobacter sp. JUb115]